MAWASDVAALLWRSTWAVVPLVVIVAAICRWVPCRPVTRHALWVVVLGAFAAPLLTPALPVSELLPRLESHLVEAAPSIPADSVPTTPTPKVSWRTGMATRFREGPSAAPPEAAPTAAFSPRALPASPRGTSIRLLARQPRVPSEEVAAPSQSSEFDRERFLPDMAERPVSDPVRSAERHGSTPGALDEPAAPECGTDFAELTPSPTEVATAELSPIKPAPSLAAAHEEADRRALSNSSGRIAAGGAAGEDPLAAAGGEPAWRVWLIALMGVRDALARVPTLPLGFWLCGIGALAFAYLAGTACYRWRFRHARRAPRSVEKMVAAVTRKIRLRRPPQVLMVDDQISPLVWCGRRARLILPIPLWLQLDQVGRRAILCHELAHLRRRDHWVRWFELFVSVLFWWHPLMWWVRRRVNEEADLCCDAWVTWLMPRERRAYAEALLRARQFSGDGRRATPAVAMGVTSAGAKRFARRLTMVMTQNARPGISVAGIGLMVALAFASWIATPVWASPLEETRDAKVKCVAKVEGDAQPTCEAKAQEATAIAILDAARPVAEAAPEIAAKALATVFGGAAEDAQVFVTVNPQGKKIWFTPDDKSLAYSLTVDAGEPLIWTGTALGHLDAVDDQLAKKMAKLNEELARLNAEMKALSVQIKVDKPKVLKVPSAGSTGHALLFGGGAGGVPGLMLGGDEEITRSYELPKGQLEMLTALMIRDDVPIKVRPYDDRIEVIATEAQHRAFEAFLGLLDDETSWQAYKLPQGKLEALSNLMTRSDVPILVQPQEDHLQAQVTGGQDKIFQAFVELIHPTGKGGKSAYRKVKVLGHAGADADVEARELFEKYKAKAGTGVDASSKAAEALSKAHVDFELLRNLQHESQALREVDIRQIQEQAKEIAERALSQARAYEIEVREHADEAHEHGAEAHEHEAEAHEHEVEVEAFEQEIETLIRQAEALVQDAKALEQDAERLYEKAASIEDENPSKARALEQKGREMERKARGLERKAERLERQAERIVERAERQKERDDDR